MNAALITVVGRKIVGSLRLGRRGAIHMAAMQCIFYVLRCPIAICYVVRDE